MLRLQAHRDPWREFRVLQRQMDDVFRGLLSSEPAAFQRPRHGPAFNVTEQADRYVIEAEVPGLRDEDISIEATTQSVTLRGKRPVIAPEGYSAHRQERGTLEFARSFSFESKLDLEHVKATLTDGVLHVELGKRAEAQPRQITIQS